MTRLRVAGSFVAALLVGMVTAPALAQTKADFDSLGVISCGQWLEAGQTGIWRGEDQMWVLGFVSGMDAGLSTTAPKVSGAGSKSDPPSMFAWLDNYCSAHPLDRLTTAAVLLWTALNKASQ